MSRNIDELKKVADKILQQVESAVDRWRALPDHILTFRPSEDAWSIKEITGHLIDSAANNHQRFVRLQLLEKLTFPLWRHYNIQLAYIIRSVDPSCLINVWQLDAQNRVTLYELMTDYLRHLEAHLDQITDTLAAVNEL
jgi:hypothetical protein